MRIILDKIFLTARIVLILPLLFAFRISLLQAEPPPPQPPPGTSAEILERKVRKQAEDEIRVKKPPEPVEVEVEKPAEEKKAAASFLARKIQIHSKEALPTAKYKDLPTDAELAPLLAPYEGREITFEDLAALNRKLEQFYRAKGYFAIVYTPPQRIEEGQVRLEMLLAKMGNLEIEGPRWSRKSKVSSYWKTPPGEILHYQEIQKSVQAMNENPDRTVKPILKAGAEPGTTDVHLKVEERFPVHAGYSFDNQGVKLTGRERTGLTIRHNNLLRLDDIFLIGTAFGENFGALYLQHMLPLTTFGTRLASHFSHSQVTPKKEFKPFGINGTAETYGLSLMQRLFRNDRVWLDSHLGFDFKEKRTRTLSVTTGWDRLRVLSLGANLQARDKTGSWGLGQDFSFGFSPHGNGFALTSRDAESHFFKAEFSAERRQKLPFGEGILTFQGQLSPDKLTPQEEFFLGGVSTVRGYPESDFGADQAVRTSFEYFLPLFFIPIEWKLPLANEPLREQIQWFGFIDHGYGRLRDPAESEHRTRNMLGVGSGFQIRFRKHVTARFEWGVPLHDEPLTESGKSQFYFRLASEF